MVTGQNDQLQSQVRMASVCLSRNPYGYSWKSESSSTQIYWCFSCLTVDFLDSLLKNTRDIYFHLISVWSNLFTESQETNYRNISGRYSAITCITYYLFIYSKRMKWTQEVKKDTFNSFLVIVHIEPSHVWFPVIKQGKFSMTHMKDKFGQHRGGRKEGEGGSQIILNRP